MPATTAAFPWKKQKGPRNGSVPRGAEKLNRFRERLDGNELFGPCLRRFSEWRRHPCRQPLRVEFQPTNPMAFRRRAQ